MEKLADAGVRYVVVGGVAVCLNGFVRATADLDILIDSEAGNVQRLLQTLQAWGEGWSRELTVEDFIPADVGSVRIVEDFALDVFTLMRARTLDEEVDYAQAARDASTYFLFGDRRVLYLSAARLIELKSGTGRPKDAIDIDVLQEIGRGLRESEQMKLETMESSVPDPAAAEGDGAQQGDFPFEGR